MRNTLKTNQKTKIEELFSSIIKIERLLGQLEILKERTTYLERNKYENDYNLSVTNDEIQDLIKGLTLLKKSLTEMINKD